MGRGIAARKMRPEPQDAFLHRRRHARRGGGPGDDQPDPPPAGSVHPKRSRRPRFGLCQRRARHGIGNDLDRRGEPPLLDPRPARQGGHGDPLVHRVDRVDGRGIDLQHTGAVGDEVDPPPRGRTEAQARALWRGHDRPGQPACSTVLVHVAGIEPRDHHLGQSGRRQPGEVIRPQHLALAHPLPVSERHGMGEDRALGLGQGNRAEPHGCLRTRVISARIETAISAGDRAPMSSPTGPWMRASACGPRSASRSSRLPWVRVEPRQPR